MKNLFELDAHDGAYAFPCGICKNRSKDVNHCRNCAVYNMTNMELYDLKESVIATIKTKEPNHG